MITNLNQSFFFSRFYQTFLTTKQRLFFTFITNQNSTLIDDNSLIGDNFLIGD